MNKHIKGNKVNSTKINQYKNLRKFDFLLYNHWIFVDKVEIVDQGLSKIQER